MKRSVILEIICYLFFLLFTYTALAKWFIYPTFLNDLDRSPLLGPLAVPISIIIPASELIVAAMLMFEKTKRYGLIGAIILMTGFTLYVGYVLGMTKERPCSCGGIIRNMSWQGHMYFNTGFTLLAMLGLWFHHTVRRKSFQEGHTGLPT